MHYRRLLHRPFTIRQWSALLVLICVLPSALAVCALVYFSYSRERANIENLAIGITRALMQAIDRDLASAKGAMESLATSPYLTDGNLAAFHRQASEIASHSPNSIVVLIDPSGWQIVNTLRPYGTKLPIHGNQEQVRDVLASRRAEVSDLYFGTVARHLIVSVDVPVIRDNKVKYILAMQSFPDRLEDILLHQRMPHEWVAAILDGNGVVVARTRESERFVGKPATPELRAMMEKESEGSAESHTMEGMPSIAFFTRSSISNWTVAIGVHRTAFTKPLIHTLIWIAVGLLLLFGAGLGLAITVSERMARSVRGLIAPAVAIGQGKQTMIGELHLREAQEVARALEEASKLLKQRTEELDNAATAQRELLESKRKVEQSEAFLDGIFQESPDAVFLLVPDGCISRANAEAGRMFDLEKAQLAALRISDILLAPRAAGNFHLREALFSPPSRHAVTSTNEAQLVGRRSDGKLFPVDVMSSPMRLTDLDLAIVTIRDVTERERNEEALRQSELRFRSALEHAPIGMAIVSLEGRWIAANNAACEMLGYTRDELTSLTFQDVTHPDDLALDLGYAARLLHGEIRSYQIEKRYIRKDGRIVPALLTGTVVRDDAGNSIHFIAQMLDISERKRSEEELKILTNRLALATRAGGIAVWDWNMLTGVSTWDERMHELYGCTPDSGGYEVWRQRIHPDDVVRAERDVATALESRGDYSSEFRIVRPDGEIRIIHSDAIISRGSDGKPIRMTGVNIDVTQNRRREEAINTALKEKEMLLKELYHRVKNNLQMISSMFNLQVRRLSNEAARVALMEAANRVRAMALVHEKLYQSGNLSSIALDTYVQELCAQLGQLGFSEQKRIHIRVDVQQLQIGLETAIPLGLVLNELISNCLKHAFPDRRTGWIDVQIRLNAQGLIHLTVADNGTGLPAGFDTGSSGNLGLQLVTALSQQLHGVFTLENRNGAYASLVFPLNYLQGDVEHA